MSMDQHQDDFRDLRRLLAIKRHEQPPPGYFSSFSLQVVSRIKAGDGEHAPWLCRLLEQAPWLLRFWESFQAKPSFAGAMSFAVCGLIAIGVFYSEAPSSPNVGAVPDVFQAGFLTTPSLEGVQTVGFSTTNDFLPPSLRGSPFGHSLAGSGLVPGPRVHTLKWMQ